jgi:hypothetical protein
VIERGGLEQREIVRNKRERESMEREKERIENKRKIERD